METVFLAPLARHARFDLLTAKHPLASLSGLKFTAGRLLDAIDISHEVLRRYPGYPLIKTEILEVAQSRLRP